MAQQANITVFDGASTPVSHILVGERVERLEDGSLAALWKESLTSVPDYAQVRSSLRHKRLPSGVHSVIYRVSVPVMESISGQNSAGYTAPPKVAHSVTFEVRMLAHERSTVTERRLARMLVVNPANNISTSVAAATAGPLSEAFDQLIMPT